MNRVSKCKRLLGLMFQVFICIIQSLSCQKEAKDRPNVREEEQVHVLWLCQAKKQLACNGSINMANDEICY